MQAQLTTRAAEIEHLKLQIAKLRRMQFGRKSEKLDHQIEQLELQLEDLQADDAEAEREMPAADSAPRKRAPLELRRAVRLCLKNTSLPSGVMPSSINSASDSRRCWLYVYTTTDTSHIRRLQSRPRCHGSNPVRISYCNFTSSCPVASPLKHLILI